MKGYPVKQYQCKTTRYCQTLDLKNNIELINEYKRRHGEDAVWKEIVAGIRQVGILEMEIYILDNRLFMILEAPADLNIEEAMSQLATLPRQQEWEDYMSIFQVSKPGESSAEKWKPMERMFHLY
jgi:L-rhamnose mutarotase